MFPYKQLLVLATGGTQFTPFLHIRLQPIMLKNLPFIPSRTSQKFYPLFLNYHLLFLYYSFNFTGSVKVMSKMHLKLFGNCAADVQRTKNLSKMNFCQ